MKIAIVGTGNLGGTLARKWAAAGYDIILGVRDATAEDVRALAAETGATVGTPSEAASGADAVLLAVPGGAVADVAASLPLDGKVVIVAANDTSGSIADMAAAVPADDVVRAFNTVAAPTLAAGGVDMFYAASEGRATEVAEELIGSAECRPIRVGDLSVAHLVDALFSAWAALAFGQKRGRGISFALAGVS